MLSVLQLISFFQQVYFQETEALTGNLPKVAGQRQNFDYNPGGWLSRLCLYLDFPPHVQSLCLPGTCYYLLVILPPHQPQALMEDSLSAHCMVSLICRLCTFVELLSHLRPRVLGPTDMILVC